jgi:hypothetical protein
MAILSVVLLAGENERLYMENRPEREEGIAAHVYS